MEAIRLLKQLEAEGRPAAPEEQAVLARYSGWGSLPQVFDERNQEWAREREELRQLLTAEEWEAARHSTLNAHYSSPAEIRAMWDAVLRMGFRGGRVLEPAAGIGHFLGFVPDSVAADTRFTAVELDSISGRIAKLLYPMADVRVMGFEQLNVPDDFYDLAISNVPFGDYPVIDRRYDRSGMNHSIHNYFFAKALDKVRPGGVVMFITSRFTMDAVDPSARQYLANRADLLLAVRLPRTAQEGAGTAVTSDILVLRKRAPGEPPAGEPWLERGWIKLDDGNSVAINEYFVRHPERILGRQAIGRGLYSMSEYMVLPDGRDLEATLREAFGALPPDALAKPRHPATEEARPTDLLPPPPGMKPGAYAVIDGRLVRNDPVAGGMVEVQLSDKARDRVVGFVAVKEALFDYYRAQLEAAPDSQIADLRRRYEQTYDAFVEKWGPLHGAANERALREDPDYYAVLATEEWDAKTQRASKGPAFRGRTIQPPKFPDRADSSLDALAIVLAKTGRVDLDEIARMTGKSVDEAARDLEGVVFRDPDGGWKTRDEYLSGNVREKLRRAEIEAASDPRFRVNVEALREVQPARVPFEKIGLNFHSPVIPEHVLLDFIAHVSGIPPSEIDLTFSPVAGRWVLELNLSRRKWNYTSRFSTNDIHAIDIIDNLLRGRKPTIRRADPETRRSYIDPEATALARERAEAIVTEFRRWLEQERPDYREEIERRYNEEVNVYRKPTFDGSHLTFPGMNPAIQLRKYQKDAVWRIIRTGNTLLAHPVGAGKTFELIAAAMELKRLGIIKKPMFVVPNHLVEQFASDFRRLYPAANVLVIGEEDGRGKRLPLSIARIAAGNWDGIIMRQSTFSRIPPGVDLQREFYGELLEEIEWFITQAREERARQRGRSVDSRLVKDLEKARERIKERLADLDEQAKRRQDVLAFEDTGVDALFVDEAHAYKNLFYYSMLRNVKGLGTSKGSARAFDLLIKVRYLQRLNGGRGIVFATGTPVSNSLVELYTLFRYLRPDLLGDTKMAALDPWLALYGKVTPQLEAKPDGSYGVAERLTQVLNPKQVIARFHQFADVLPPEAIQTEKPALAGGRRKVVVAQATDQLRDYIQALADRLQAIRSGKVPPHEDNYLKVNNDARLAAIDLRLVMPGAPDDPNSKLNLAVENIVNIWKRTADDRLTQVVFLDVGVPKGQGRSRPARAETAADAELEQEGVSDDEAVRGAETDQERALRARLYEDIKRKLVARGVPQDEIAFIHDASQPQQLFDAVNEGRVRIVLGSTAKMGVGTNMQRRLVALHHLDTPWRPADLEQREGRILRPGNQNKEVEIYSYVTKGTFDEYLWQLIESKAAMIWRLMKGEIDEESVADPFSDAMVADASVARALASGKPEVMEHVEVTARLAQLRAARRAWEEEVQTAKNEVRWLRERIASLQRELQDARDDDANRPDTTGDKFRATILGRSYSERKEAQQALEKAVAENWQLGTSAKIGAIGDFSLYYDHAADEASVRKSGVHAIQLRRRRSLTVPASIASIEATLRHLSSDVQGIQRAIEEAERKLKFAEERASQTKFEGDDEIRELEIRKQQLEEVLGGEPDHSAEAEVASDEGVERGVEDVQAMPAFPTLAQAPAAPARATPKVAPHGARAALVRAIAEKFAVPIRQGRLRTKGARGEYKRREQVIRLKAAEDLRAAAHELGHHLANVMGLQPSRYPDLEHLGATLYPNATPDKQRAEGLAEFVALYVSDPAQAQNEAPVFYADWEQALRHNGEIAQALSEVQRLWAQYHAMHAVDRVKAHIVHEVPGPRLWLSTGERLYTEWVDDLHPIYKAMRELVGPDDVKTEWDVDVLRNPYVLARLARGRFRRAEAWLTGKPMTLDGKPVGPSLKEILDPVRERIDDFEAYLVAKRALELNARGIESGIDTQTAEAAVRELETPAFQRAAEQLYRLQDALIEVLVDAGMLNDASAKTIRDLNQYYVPFYRLIGEEAATKAGAGLGRRWVDLPQPVKKIRGSGRSVLSPLVSIMRNILYIHDVAARNMAARSLADLADKAEGMGWLIEKLPTPVEAKGVKLEDLKDALVEAGVPEDVLDASDLERIAVTFQPVRFARWREKKENILVIWRDGEPTFYQAHPELYRALEALDNPPTHWIVRMLSLPTRILRAGATLNPEFALRNPVRDTYEAWVLRRYGFTPFADTIRGLAHVLKRDELYWRWVNSGGAQSTFVSVERDYLNKEFRRLLDKLTPKEKAIDYIRSPITFLETISQAWEEATRVWAFARALEAEGRQREGLMKAGYWSREVTLDFNRAGARGRQYNAIKAFFNAGMQGADRVARAFRADPKGMTLRALLYITLPTLALYLLNRRDPRYEELPRWRRDLFWAIPAGNGLIYVPKPPVLGILFGTIPERFLEWLDKQDPKAFDELYQTLTTSVLPGDPMRPFDWLPDALTPWVEVATNYDSFRDKPIVPRGEQELLPEAQYSPQTSEAARAIGRITGQSPRKVEHLIYGYGGGLARHALNFLDMLAGRAREKRTVPELVPGLQAFTGRPFVGAESLDRFYDELERLEGAYRTRREELRRRGLNPDALKPPARLRVLRQIRDRLAQLRLRQRQVLEAPGIPATIKRREADRINVMMVNLVRAALGLQPVQP